MNVKCPLFLCLYHSGLLTLIKLKSVILDYMFIKRPLVVN